MKIGIISDKHNLIRPETAAALTGCDAILHGGDISRQEVLDELRKIAPVYVVRGNNDKEWAEHIPWSLDFELAGLRIYMTHKKKDLPEDLSPYDLVVYGHSHKYDLKEPAEGEAGPVLLNPGSCGPRRFGQPITLAVAEIEEVQDPADESAGDPNGKGGASAKPKITIYQIDIPHPAPRHSANNA